MIYMVSGNLGSGKTAYCVCRALASDVYMVLSNFPITGLHCKFLLLPKNPTDWGNLPYQGFRRSDKHPKIIVILDELPEMADQFSRKNSALLSYLRHSDKIGHTVYLISQRFGHTNKTIRQLACEYFYIFVVFGKRFILRLNALGKITALPKTVNIKPAFGHYDTAAVVSPEFDFNPHFFPLRSFDLYRKSIRFTILYYILLMISFLLFSLLWIL